MPERFEEDMDLLSIIRILRKRFLLIVIVIIPVTVVSFVYLDEGTPVYKSSAKVSVGPEVFEVHTRDGNIVKQSYSISHEIELFNSSAVAQKATEVLKEKYGYKYPLERLISQVSGSYKISRPKGSASEIVISSVSKEPKRAYDTVRAVIDGYLKHKKEVESKFFEDTYKAFEDQLDVARDSLHASELKLTEYIVNNKDIALAIKDYDTEKDGADTRTLRVSGINDKYLKIKSEILNRESFLSNIEELAKADKLVALSVISKGYPELANIELKNTLFEKEEALNNLLLVNEEIHPEVMMTRGALESVWRKIDNEINSAITSISMDLSMLRIQEKELSGLLSAGLQKRLVEYNAIRRDAYTKSLLYNNLAKNLEQVKIGEKLKRYTELKVIAEPRLPRKPFNKNLPKRVFTSIAIGLFCSGALIYLLELLDTSIKDVEALERLIDIPVLAMIPRHRMVSPRR
ncbi:GumC family protein [Candidatus Omnitrophota bacterium]